MYTIHIWSNIEYRYKYIRHIFKLYMHKHIIHKWYIIYIKYLHICVLIVYIFNDQFLLAQQSSMQRSLRTAQICVLVYLVVKKHFIAIFSYITIHKIQFFILEERCVNLLRYLLKLKTKYVKNFHLILKLYVFL